MKIILVLFCLRIGLKYNYIKLASKGVGAVKMGYERGDIRQECLPMVDKSIFHQYKKNNRDIYIILYNIILYNI